jgi:hypothetical protein
MADRPAAMPATTVSVAGPVVRLNSASRKTILAVLLIPKYAGS